MSSPEARARLAAASLRGAVAPAELLPLAQLRTAPGAVLLEQALLRRRLVAAFLDGVRHAPTALDALAVLRGHAGALEALGLHDEAARLRAFARAVEADFARADAEALELERLAVQAPP